MSHQFKPGDPAVIVGANRVISNIGKGCELVEFLEPGKVSKWRDPSDGLRLRNDAGEVAWLVVGDGINSACGSSGWVLAVPRHLMPLRGDFEPLQQQARAVPA